MSLNFDFGNVKNYETECWVCGEDGKPIEDDDGNFTYDPTLHTLIWSSISVQLGSITESNAGQWFERLTALEMLYGAARTETIVEEEANGAETSIRKDLFWDPADILRFVGLTTNVSSETDRKFWGGFKKEFSKRQAAKFKKAQEASDV